MTRVLLLASSNTSDAARRHAQLVITPRNEGMGLLEFHQLDRACEAGRRAVHEALERTPEALVPAVTASAPTTKNQPLP